MREQKVQRVLATAQLKLERSAYFSSYGLPALELSRNEVRSASFGLRVSLSAAGVGAGRRAGPVCVPLGTPSQGTARWLLRE